MLSRRIGSLDLAFGFDERGIKVGLSSGFKTVDLSIDNAPKLADGFQRYNHEGGNIEAYYPKKIIILELASDGFCGFLGVQDTVFFAHAAGLVYNKNYGSVLFLSLWFLWLHGEYGLDWRAAIASRGEAGIASKHQKTIALSCVPLDGGEIVRGEFTSVDIIKDDDTIACR